jgi:hypothetical protein
MEHTFRTKPLSVAAEQAWHASLPVNQKANTKAGVRRFQPADVPLRRWPQQTSFVDAARGSVIYGAGQQALSALFVMMSNMK